MEGGPEGQGLRMVAILLVLLVAVVVVRRHFCDASGRRSWTTA